MSDVELKKKMSELCDWLHEHEDDVYEQNLAIMISVMDMENQHMISYAAGDAFAILLCCERQEKAARVGLQKRVYDLIDAICDEEEEGDGWIS